MINKVLNYFSFVLFLSAVSFTGCSGGGSSATISMTTERGEVEIRMEGEGAAVIDWGDGSAPETVTLSKRPTCKHAYTERTTHSISIDGHSITWLECPGNELTSLDVSNNPALTYLNCRDNELTSLDVTKNIAIEILWCADNRLNAEGLNFLFSALHSKTGAYSSQSARLYHLVQYSAYGDDYTIYIAKNPGTDGCDQSIAEAKGWTVDTTRFY